MLLGKSLKPLNQEVVGTVACPVTAPCESREKSVPRNQGRASKGRVTNNLIRKAENYKNVLLSVSESKHTFVVTTFFSIFFSSFYHFCTVYAGNHTWKILNFIR